MAEKKFYWLRLQRDFFKRHDIRIIEEMENGKDYLLFYLKLLVESIDHNGCLRFSDTIPYNEKMLSVVTNTNIDIVRAALNIFRELNLIEILEDKTLYMSEVQKMIGSAKQDDSTREATRLRVQAYRERAKQAKIESGECYGNATCNVEKELELEKEIEKDIYIYTKDTYGDSANAPCANDHSIDHSIDNTSGHSNASGKDAEHIFQELWSLYPRKKGKGQVSMTAKKRIANVGIDEMTRAIDRYKTYMAGKEERFVMYGSTFFTSGYVDYLDANYEGDAPSGGGSRLGNTDMSRFDNFAKNVGGSKNDGT